MSKITKTTFKSFIHRNGLSLFIKVKSDFDGMVDCVMQKPGAEFNKVSRKEEHQENTLGINGLWLVGGGRDYFTAYEDADFQGFEVLNCCGSSIIAIRK